MASRLFQEPDELIGMDVELHTTDGTFSGTVMFLDGRATTLYDNVNNEIHIVFDDHLVGMSIYKPSEVLLSRVKGTT